MSLRIALAMLIQEFNVSFAPGETGVAFEDEPLDTFVVTLPPLYLQLTPTRVG